MSSTGSISASPDGLLMALIQYPVPVVNTPEDVQASVDEICRMVGSTKAGYPDLDLIVSRNILPPVSTPRFGPMMNSSLDSMIPR